MGCKPLDKQKMKHKKGLWSPYEDEKLRNYILRHGFGSWSSIPVNAGLQRNGKSCRLRWINYLRPGLKRGTFSIEEEDTVFTFHQILGNKWSQIAQHLPGRTDNEIKNYWHSYLKKRVAKITKTENEAHGKNEHINELIQPSESSLSSLNATPQNSSVSSFESIKGSPTDTDQSLQLEHLTGAQKCNLPKVMFSEWLSFDQYLGQETRNSEFAPCFKNSSFEEALNHSLLLDEGSFGSEMNTNSESISVDDILQSEFKFEDRIMENGLIDYFPGEFNMNCDDLYI